MTVQKKAYAKINLTLELLGTRRADGYHDILSIMHKVPLFDEVTVEAKRGGSGIALTCDRDVCRPEDNLAYRAAKAYLEKYKENGGEDVGIYIDLKKNIPSKAGLAGGSSDAAAVLDALSEAIGNADDAEIEKIASDIGSDVPFCLEKHKCALCSGRGEITQEIKPLCGVYAVIIFPSIDMPTGSVYSEYDKTHGDDYSKNASIKMAEKLNAGESAESVLGLMCNDFSPICEKKCALIAEARKELEDGGAYSQMSGSGSAVFGIFTSESEYLSFSERKKNGNNQYFYLGAI